MFYPRAAGAANSCLQPKSVKRRDLLEQLVACAVRTSTTLSPVGQTHLSFFSCCPSSLVSTKDTPEVIHGSVSNPAVKWPGPCHSNRATPHTKRVGEVGGAGLFASLCVCALRCGVAHTSRIDTPLAEGISVASAPR